MATDIQELRAEDAASIASVDGGNGWNSDPALWDRYLSDHRAGRRTVLIAWVGSSPVGYGNLCWTPDYEPFRAMGIPEISNMSVAVAHRKQGTATALIRTFEDLAKTAGRSEIGLGVGLYPDYGDAQRLYWRLKYRPDGRGVTYRGRTVMPSEQVRLDDDLVLWLSKTL